MSETEGWKPTMQLRWVVSPTPGEPDVLQQLWTRPDTYEGYPDEEWWRPIDRVPLSSSSS